MVKRSSSKRQKLQVTKGKTQYVYDINGAGTYEVIPLQMGSGTYEVTLYEQTSGTSYAPKLSTDIKANLVDENINYLYPNQVVMYTADSKAVALAAELCAGLTTPKEKYGAVRDYIKSNLVYDYMKALQVTSNQLATYVPDVDSVLSSKVGICFDFASLAACMLRSQGVETKLVKGFADKERHAWNEILIDGSWARFDLTFAVTGTKVSDGGYIPDEYY